MFDKIALAVLSFVLVVGYWFYRRAAARKQADADSLGGMFFNTAVWFLYFLGKAVDNLPFRIVLGVAALASIVVSFRMMRRHGKAQKAKVQEEYQRFLEKRKNQTASQTPR
jgi:hypothetical protein